jgi:hypothetical protein
MTRTIVAAAALAALAAPAVALMGRQGAHPKPIVIVVRGDVERRLPRVLGLERSAARAPGVAAVRGPATLVNAAVTRAKRRLAAMSGGTRQGYADALVRLGSIGRPALSNRAFVTELVYGSGTAAKPPFRAYLPDEGRALVYVRPRAGLGRAATAALARRLERLARASRLDVSEVRR